MKARKFHLEVEQGSDYKKAIPIVEPALEDFSGWSVAGQIRPEPLSETILHEIDLTISGTDVILYIPAQDSSGWDWLRAVYDLELTSPEGAIGRFLKGDVIVDPEVTRGE